MHTDDKSKHMEKKKSEMLKYNVFKHLKHYLEIVTESWLIINLEIHFFCCSLFPFFLPSFFPTYLPSFSSFLFFCCFFFCSFSHPLFLSFVVPFPSCSKMYLKWILKIYSKYENISKEVIYIYSTNIICGLSYFQ